MVNNRSAMDILALAQAFHKQAEDKRKVAVDAMLKGASTDIPSVMADFCAKVSNGRYPGSQFVFTSLGAGAKGCYGPIRLEFRATVLFGTGWISMKFEAT